MSRTAASTLEFALLGLIRQGLGSGYKLRKQFSTTPMGHYSDSPGSIYPALKRLEQRRWIRRLKEDGGPRGRQSYGVTPAGESALRAWMMRPMAREDVVKRQDELLLRFAFMGQAADGATAITFLEGYARECAGYARELRKFLATMPQETAESGRLALENGVAGYETQARWARRALARLRRPK